MIHVRSIKRDAVVVAVVAPFAFTIQARIVSGGNVEKIPSNIVCTLPGKCRIKTAKLEDVIRPATGAIREFPTITAALMFLKNNGVIKSIVRIEVAMFANKREEPVIRQFDVMTLESGYQDVETYNITFAPCRKAKEQILGKPIRSALKRQKRLSKNKPAYPELHKMEKKAPLKTPSGIINEATT